MPKISVLLCVCIATALSLFATIAVQAQELEPGNRVDARVTVKAFFKPKENTFTYRYTVANGKTAHQSIWRFVVVLQDETLARDLVAPSGWFKPRVKPNDWGYMPSIRAVSWVGWGGPPEVHIGPGQKEKDFTFGSIGSLPGIVDYYVEGYAPAPSFPAGGAPSGPIPGYDDLTPYGPGVVGRTVGPVMLPTPLIPAVFVDYLIGMVEEATRLGWIHDKEPRRSLLVDLKEAKAALLRGDIKAARKNLKDALAGAHAGKHGGGNGKKENDKEDRGEGNEEPSAEGAALLRYNLRYLIASLQSPDKN